MSYHVSPAWLRRLDSESQEAQAAFNDYHNADPKKPERYELGNDIRGNVSQDDSYGAGA